MCNKLSIGCSSHKAIMLKLIIHVILHINMSCAFVKLMIVTIQMGLRLSIRMTIGFNCANPTVRKRQKN
jgi:hypothetical protein